MVIGHADIGEGLDFNKIEKMAAGLRECVVTNEKGTVVGKAEYDSKGRLVHAIEYSLWENDATYGHANSYDEKGRLIEKVYYENKVPIQKIKYTYRDNRVDGAKTFSCSHNVFFLIASSSYRYDKNDKLVEQLVVDTEGTVTGIYRITYSEDGKVQMEKGYDGEDNLTGEYTCHFDEKGNPVKYEEKDYEYDYFFFVITEYQYDEKGRIVKEVQYNSDDMETPSYVFFYTYNGM
jgi:hypothetical protein